MISDTNRSDIIIVLHMFFSKLNSRLLSKRYQFKLHVISNTNIRHEKEAIDANPFAEPIFKLKNKPVAKHISYVLFEPKKYCGKPKFIGNILRKQIKFWCFLYNAFVKIPAIEQFSQYILAKGTKNTNFQLNDAHKKANIAI